MVISLAVRLTDDRTELLCVHHSRGRTKATRRLTIPFSPPAQENGSETATLKKQAATFLKKNRIRNENVFVSIPREAVVLREIQLPMVVEENIHQVLAYELDRYTPFSKDEAYFAFDIVVRDIDTKTLTLLLTAVETTRLQRYLTRLTLLGLKPTAVEVTSTAMLRALRHIRHTKEAPSSPHAPLLAMVDIHETGYELIITEGPHLRYTRSMSTVDDLVTNIEVELNTGIAAIKRQRQDLGEVILQTSGTSEHLTHDSLETRLGVRVSSAEPFASESMVLMGLGLRGINGNQPAINLLPQQTKPESHRRRYAPTIALITLAACLAIGYIVIAVMNNRDTLNGLNHELRSLSPQIAAMTILQDTTALVRQQFTTLESLAPKHPDVLDMLRELTTIVPDKHWLTNLTYKGHSIMLTGKARSSPAHLISLLEHSSLFYDVNFSEPVSGQEFRIHAKVRMSPTDTILENP